VNGDLLRVFTVFACTLDVGAIVVLYTRIGRWFLPKLWMRGMMVGMLLILAGIATGSYARLGEPVKWWNVLLSAGAATVGVAFVGLYHWYGTEAGRAHAAKMIR
jgi:hypothetical protein